MTKKIESGLMFPKQGKKKKRKKHRESIMHRKDGTCYLCRILYDDWMRKSPVEEHHVFGGSNRDKSEEYGLKVYLCQEHHQNWRKESVHYKKEYMEMLRIRGQKAFEKEYPDKDFCEIFGKNYV